MWRYSNSKNKAFLSTYFLISEIHTYWHYGDGIAQPRTWKESSSEMEIHFYVHNNFCILVMTDDTLGCNTCLALATNLLAYQLQMNLLIYSIIYRIRWIFGGNLIWRINHFWVIGRFYIGERYCILHALGNKKDNFAEFNLADFHNLPNCQNKFYAKFSSYTVLSINGFFNDFSHIDKWI